jgi:hypothetical protein
VDAGAHRPQDRDDETAIIARLMESIGRQIGTTLRISPWRTDCGRFDLTQMGPPPTLSPGPTIHTTVLDVEICYTYRFKI